MSKPIIDKHTEFMMIANYMRSVRNLLFQKVYLFIRDKESLYNDLLKIKYHPIKLHVHKIRDIFSILEPLVSEKLVVLDDNEELTVDTACERNHKVYFVNVKTLLCKDDLEGERLRCDELYRKTLKLFIDLFINYSVDDYERFFFFFFFFFLQLEISIDDIKNNISERCHIFLPRYRKRRVSEIFYKS